jgi:hypothetical protein
VATIFYIPEHHLPDKERRRLWENGETPSLLGEGKAASAQAWIFQTWIEVREKTDAILSTTFPNEGSVITLSNFLQPAFRASNKQCVAAIVADFLPHPGAQIQILQNAAHARRLPGSVFIPHWPQPNLTPRNPARGQRFETLAYFGDPQNLAPELSSPEFLSRLRTRCGLEISFRGPDRWHDYSDVDAVLAVRDFSRAAHLHKPATKLYNAWLAGVPLVTGHDSACVAEGVAGQDHLRVDSPADLLAALEKLKNSPVLREKIVATGQKKTASRSRDAVRQIWIDFLNQKLPAEFERWRSQGSAFRKIQHAYQSGVFFLDRIFRS